MRHTIRRAPRRDRYVVVDQKAIEDMRLSWAARGLLAYLLSRPSNWEVLVRDLIKRGNLGRDGIHAVLKKLRAAGYVRHDKVRDAKGRLRGGTYTVFEIPCTDLPYTAEPNTASPDPAKPDGLLNTEVNLITKNHTLQTPTQAGVVFSAAHSLRFPSWLTEELRSNAQEIVVDLAPHEAQWVVDEWVGAMLDKKIKHSPLGFLVELARRCQEGTLEPRYAFRLAP